MRIINYSRNNFPAKLNYFVRASVKKLSLVVFFMMCYFLKMKIRIFNTEHHYKKINDGEGRCAATINAG